MPRKDHTGFRGGTQATTAGRVGEPGRQLESEPTPQGSRVRGPKHAAKAGVKFNLRAAGASAAPQHTQQGLQCVAFSVMTRRHK